MPLASALKVNEMSELKPCVFCGAGTSSFDESQHWTGQRYITLKVYLRHWCKGEDNQIQIRRKTGQECIDAWNEMMSRCNAN